MAEVTDVQRTLKVQLSDGTAPTPMSSGEFRAAVREGRICATTPVWGRVFTNGEWQTAADLRIFHAASPTAVPLGPYLQALEDAKAQAARDLEAASARKHPQYEYVDSLVSTAPRRLHVSQAEAVWILRVYPAFEDGEYVIVEDRGTVLHVERYRFDLQQDTLEGTLVRQDHAVLARPELSLLARDRHLLEKLLQSPPSPRLWHIRDGIRYRLEYCSSQLSTTVEWRYPTADQERESQLTSLFGQIVAKAFGDDTNLYAIRPAFPQR